jgi:hypothetical protein
MLRPIGAAAADDSDWTDPDIRDMMDPGNGHDVPAGARRGEALPSRDRVSVLSTLFKLAKPGRGGPGPDKKFG